MPATTPKYVVRPAKDLEEAKELWWPLMLDLGWVRPSSPSPLMYEGVLLLIPPVESSTSRCKDPFRRRPTRQELVSHSSRGL
jgi:hypothetical protein